MKKRLFSFFCFLLSFALLSGAVLASGYFAESGSVPVMGSVSAQSYALMDADTGEVLKQLNADLPLPMASTTKIMTCLVALEEGDLAKEISVPQEAVGIEGSSVYLVRGETLTLSELLYALMLESANDAAVAIALHISGSVSDFVAKMNEKAAQIGMTNTHFTNPNGLPDDAHHSTAKDLSILMCCAMKNEAFAEIASTQTKTIRAPEGKSRFLSNHNRLLRNYEPCVAGKTGFTKTAGRCLVTAAQKDGKLLVCTTLGAPDDWNDHKELYQYGFSLYSERTLAQPASFSFSLPVVGGMENAVSVTNSDSVLLALRQEQTVDTVVELPPFSYAPVKAGDQVGRVLFLLNGKEVAQLPLLAGESIKQKEIKLSFWQKIWNRIWEWITFHGRD